MKLLLLLCKICEIGKCCHSIQLYNIRVMEQLYTFAASVLSHSQYRDELGLLKREDSTQHTPTKFLSLDCDDLANSLMCIPLHERLGIEASVFEVRET